MVVNRGGRARRPNSSLQLTTALLIAACSGCAAPWLKTASEAELPLAESQAPKVYSKSTPSGQRPSDPQQPRSAPSEVDLRMARELERLTKLNDQLTKTIAKSSAAPAAQPSTLAAPQKDEQERARQSRLASQDAISKDLRSEFVELATVKQRPGVALDKALTKFSLSDEAESPEQSPSPVVEKIQPRNQPTLLTPKPSTSQLLHPRKSLLLTKSAAG